MQTFQEVQEGAKEALTQAEDLVSQLEQAAADLVDCSKHAEQAQRYWSFSIAVGLNSGTSF